MAPRLTFDFAVPRGGRPPKRDDADPVRVLVISDLSGEARRTAAGATPLTAAQLVRIDVDNFEDVLRRMRPCVSVQAKAAAHSLSFESMDDFHPDQLYTALEAVVQVRHKAPALDATISGVFDSSAAVSGVFESAADGGRTVEDDGATLDRLLGRRSHEAVASAPATGAAGVVDRLLRDAVSQHIVHDTRPEQTHSIDSLEDAICDEVRSVLHAPAFQRIEAAWRALRWLVCQNPLGDALEVRVLDATKAELVADLRACQGQLERSMLYRLVVQPGSAFSLVIGDFGVTGSEDDVPLLSGLGAVAAQAGGCFLAAAEPVLWGCRDLAQQPERGYWSQPDEAVAAHMDLVRKSAVAPFIGLCMPRVLGRVPYGKRSDPTERFAFTELVPNPAHSDFLWLNPAFACAQVLLSGADLELGDLPHAVYRCADGDARKPCAEVYLDEASAEHALALGLMPLISRRDRNAVQLLRMQSIADPPAPLAFRGVR